MESHQAILYLLSLVRSSPDEISSAVLLGVERSHRLLNARDAVAPTMTRPIDAIAVRDSRSAAVISPQSPAKGSET
jgi:hypothetical protein